MHTNAEMLNVIDDRLHRLEKAVFGNGRPGLLERMAALEQAQRTQTWLLRAIVGAVFTNLAGLAFMLLRRGVGAL